MEDPLQSRIEPMKIESCAVQKGLRIMGRTSQLDVAFGPSDKSLNVLQLLPNTAGDDRIMPDQSSTPSR